MSASKTRDEIERLIEEIDDVPVSQEEGEETMLRLGLDAKTWGAKIRTKAAAAAVSARKARFAEASRARANELGRLAARRAEPVRPIAEQRRCMKSLLAKVPADVNVSAHFHKFEEATSEELAEMITALRHLVGEDDEGTQS